MTNEEFIKRCKRLESRISRLIEDVGVLSLEIQAGIGDFNDLQNHLYDARDILWAQHTYPSVIQKAIEKNMQRLKQTQLEQK